MKLPSLLNRLKSIKKHLKGRRLIVTLIIVTALLVGAVSVAAYTMNLQKEPIRAAEKTPEKLADLAPAEKQDTSAVAEEKTTPPADSQPTSTPRSVATLTKPAADKLKPITAQIGWWNGATIYTDQGATIVSFGSTSVRIIGSAGGGLRWQAEANVDGVVRVINSGSTTIAPGQLTYDIPQFDNWELPYVTHSGDMLVRMHVTSPSDVATEWRVPMSGTF